MRIRENTLGSFILWKLSIHPLISFNFCRMWCWGRRSPSPSSTFIHYLPASARSQHDEHSTTHTANGWHVFYHSNDHGFMTAASNHVVTELHMPLSTSHHQQREFDVHCVDTWDFCRKKQVWLVLPTHFHKCLGSLCKIKCTPRTSIPWLICWGDTGYPKNIDNLLRTWWNPPMTQPGWHPSRLYRIHLLLANYAHVGHASHYNNEVRAFKTTNHYLSG